MSKAYAQARLIGLPVLKMVACGLILGIPAMLLANMYLAENADSLFNDRPFITAALLMLASGGSLLLWFEIAQRTRAERVIADQSEALHRQAVVAANIDTLVLMTDAEGIVEWCNAEFSRITGYQLGDIKGKHIPEVLHGPRQPGDTGIDIAQQEGQGFRSALQLYTRDGREYWADIGVQPLLTTTGILSGHLVLMRDITAQKQQEIQLERIAYYDPLTGLPNRALLLVRLRAAMLSGGGEHPALIMIKFPRASALRSSLGHALSDELTLAIVARLHEGLETGQMVARLAAGSFAVLAPVKRPAQALSVAYALQAVLAKPYGVGDREVHMVSSIGVSVAELGGTDPTAVLRDAEIAMQAVSTTSMDEVVLFDIAMRQQLEARHRLETDLRRAIYFDTTQLAVVFQPIVDLKDLSLLGFEALARWKHPEKGWIPPDQFIGIAEETGMIVPLWNFVFAEACRYLVRWQNMRPDQMHPLFISVNLSAVQFFYPGLMRSVSAVIDLTQIDPSWIKFEITESGLMENAEAALQQMEGLKSLKCTLAIDDFGTGYSSLSYLQKLPVDDIKIDRSFIMQMHKSPSNRELVRIITELGRILGKRVIAEGIETELDLHVLRQMNCDQGQGYYFYKPMLPEAAEALVHEQVRRLQEIEPVQA
jgi:PAS domain S-box-containing protein/diguanylate cyclase (GGDEF)-like protein